MNRATRRALKFKHPHLMGSKSLPKNLGEQKRTQVARGVSIFDKPMNAFSIKELPDHPTTDEPEPTP